ncbi:MAG: TetR/AcrR family transcriptional regulator, partial [Geminicoccaceae bacterium]
MPYTQHHKRKTRSRIVESARILFNRHGFADVSIDQIMAEAGLTRGGFYNHFKNKEELFAEAVDSFLEGRGAQTRDEAGVDMSASGLAITRQMIEGYLSPKHLGDLDGQCPMIALPSDVARSNP